MLIILIILLLAAMLMPALDQSIHRAHMAYCSATLKKVQGASIAFAIDNERHLPKINSGGTFDYHIRNHFGGEDSTSSDLYLCPSNPDEHKLQYGMNHYNYDDVDGDGVNNHYDTLSNTNYHLIGEPSWTAHIADADTTSPHDIGGMQSGTTNWPLTSLAESLHLGGFQVAHIDGHVEFFENTPNHGDAWAIRKTFK
jgi:hypothetical protein